jgi:hypothetical protein
LSFGKFKGLPMPRISPALSTWVLDCPLMWRFQTAWCAS